MPRQRNQFGLPAMMAAFALLALWFGWAEVVGAILRDEARSETTPTGHPAIVFRSP